MYDRIFNEGRVIDFLRTLFIDFPIFNIADCAVVIGAGLLILHFVIDTVKEEKEKKAQKQEAKESVTEVSKEEADEASKQEVQEVLTNDEEPKNKNNQE